MRPRGARAGAGAVFGVHLTVDGLDADPEKLNDMHAVFQYLAELPERIGMHAISPPYVIAYDGGTKPEDAGLTGFIIIAESHISIHTFPRKRFVTVDVYSCRPFDTDAALAFTKEAFGIGQTEVHTLARGHGFPRT